MSEKVYFYLLIVCGFFCQGIIASLPTNSRKSVDFLVRHKRVINHEPDGHALAKIQNINYIVHIKHETRFICVGAILSRFNVITAASCIAFHTEQYKVQSGAAYIFQGTNHSITDKLFYYGNPPYGKEDGIALLKVNPPFIIGATTGIITLHVEPVVPGTMALVSGWGCQHPTSPSMPGRQRLRSITLPIMKQKDCIATYAGYFRVTNKYICTYDERKLCANYDIGTPLVLDNALVGIHNYKGCFMHIKNPDVFIDVQLPEYNVWIRSNIIH